MKRFATLAVALFFAFALSAQTIQDVKAIYSGMEMPACRISLQSDKATVSDVLAQRLNEAMLQTTSSEGYTVAFNQSFAAIYDMPVDFFAKVEEQGKKSNKVVVLTVFARCGDHNANQEVINANVRSFVGSFPDYVARYEAKQNMAKEQQNLAKAQKQQAKAAAAAASVDKDIAKQQAKIDKQDQAIAKQQEKIEKQQAKLSQMKDKAEQMQRKREQLANSLDKTQARKTEADEKLRSADEKVRASEAEVDNFRRQAGQ
ncbi:MAG: hypothetical protein IJU81_06010 [Bacteroidales bacterium]|nr:hypothetical protein [Bacteroidales bacterium]